MTRKDYVRLVCFTLIVASASIGRVSAAQDAEKAGTATAATANPELVGALSKELGSTPEQAAGAAGALFGLAKSRLSADEFSQVAKAVPGMDSLLAAAPTGGAPSAGAVGTAGALAGAGGAATGLASATSAFTKLGLKPDMVAKAVPILTSYVSKSGGANVGTLLADALK